MRRHRAPKEVGCVYYLFTFGLGVAVIVLIMLLFDIPVKETLNAIFSLLQELAQWIYIRIATIVTHAMG